MRKELLSQSQYLFVKKHAYKTAKFLKNLQMRDFANFIKDGIPYDIQSLEYDVFICTLLLPKDISLIEDYIKDKNMNALSKKYGVPMALIAHKIGELEQNNFLQLFNQGFISEDEANQNIDLLEILSPTDRALTTFFPDQPYIDYKEKEQRKLKEEILTTSTKKIKIFKKAN